MFCVVLMVCSTKIKEQVSVFPSNVAQSDSNDHERTGLFPIGCRQ